MSVCCFHIIDNSLVLCEDKYLKNINNEELSKLKKYEPFKILKFKD